MFCVCTGFTISEKCVFLRIKLKAFKKFKDTTKALKAAAAICEGKLDSNLAKFLSKKAKDGKGKLAVLDSKLGNLIKEKCNIKCIANDSVIDLMRGIRSQLDSLLNLPESEKVAFQLGLSHSLARFKLKFSPDKVDTMIIQAIGKPHTSYSPPAMSPKFSNFIVRLYCSLMPSFLLSPTSHSPSGRAGQRTQHIRHESEGVVWLAFS